MTSKRRGEITSIKNLFEVYKQKLFAPQKVVIHSFQEITREIFKTTINPQHISYNTTTRTLSLHLPGPLKSEILLQKDAILTLLRKKLGEKSAPQQII